MKKIFIYTIIALSNSLFARPVQSVVYDLMSKPDGFFLGCYKYANPADAPETNTRRYNSIYGKSLDMEKAMNNQDLRTINAFTNAIENAERMKKRKSYSYDSAYYTTGSSLKILYMDSANKTYYKNQANKAAKEKKSSLRSLIFGDSSDRKKAPPQKKKF